MLGGEKAHSFGRCAWNAVPGRKMAVDALGDWKTFPLGRFGQVIQIRKIPPCNSADWFWQAVESRYADDFSGLARRVLRVVLLFRKHSNWL